MPSFSMVVFTGSVAQITKHSLRDSRVLVSLQEQAHTPAYHTPDLPHDALARLQCSLKQRGSMKIWFDPETGWLSPVESGAALPRSPKPQFRRA